MEHPARRHERRRPRPEQPQYVEELRKSIPYYNTQTLGAARAYRLGAGQLRLRQRCRGVDVKLSYDLYYIKRQSVALDLLIIARTMFAVATLKGR